MKNLDAYEDLAGMKRRRLINRTHTICFLSLILIHLLDQISTIIGMSLGAIETNPVAAYLFTFGVLGYIGNTIYVLCVFWLCLGIIDLLNIIYKKMTYEEAPLSYIIVLYMIFTVTVFSGIGMAVLNNISVIISLMIS